MSENLTSLHGLTGAWLELYAMADDPDMDPEVWFDTIEGLEGEIEDKADGYASVRMYLKGDVAALKAEEERIHARRVAVENNIKRMESRLQEMMEQTGKTKFKTLKYSFGIQNNPPSVIIDDESKIPHKYLIPQEPKIDKTAIKELLKSGITCEYAHLAQTRCLRIR